MATTKDEQRTAMLESERVPAAPSSDLDGEALIEAKAARKNSAAVMRANWDREVANKEVRTIVIPSNSYMGRRDPNGVAVQVNGLKFPRLALDTPIEVPNSIANIIENALAGEKTAAEREKAFSEGRLVIPVGGE